jgi:hypothetical protein
MTLEVYYIFLSWTITAAGNVSVDTSSFMVKTSTLIFDSFDPPAMLEDSTGSK